MKTRKAAPGSAFDLAHYVPKVLPRQIEEILGAVESVPDIALARRLALPADVVRRIRTQGARA